MKIAFIVDEFPNISETFVLNQITGLIDRGHDVVIYAGRPGSHGVTHADIMRYDLLRRVFYYDSGYRRIPSGKFFRLVKALPIVIRHFPKRPVTLLKSLNVLRFGRMAASLSLLYEACAFSDSGKCEYDIVHCHFGPNGNLAVSLRDIGVVKGKVVTAFHGYDMSSYINDKGNGVYNALFRLGDMFLPVSERWKDELISLGCKREKIVVHRMGIDTAKFTFSPRGVRENGTIHLLTVARLIQKKGVNYGIQAVAKLVGRYPQIEYKIVGDGPLKNQLQHLIDQLGIEGNVELLGWKSHDDTRRFMKQADILLAPSATSEDGDQEGIPVALMEALAEGLPVLSTQHSGISELIQDGRSGFLVPERDIDALAEKLEYLIRNRQIWAEMGRAGRGCVEEHYDINKANNQLVELYRRLLRT